MKVLIAIEDQTCGEAMVEFASKHQWPRETVFQLLHVTHQEELGTACWSPYCCDAARFLVVERERRTRQLLQRVSASLRAKLGPAKIDEVVAIGSPKHVILDIADQWEADMIIVGSHGQPA